MPVQKRGSQDSEVALPMEAITRIAHQVLTDGNLEWDKLEGNRHEHTHTHTLPARIRGTA